MWLVCTNGEILYIYQDDRSDEIEDTGEIFGTLTKFDEGVTLRYVMCVTLFWWPRSLWMRRLWCGDLPSSFFFSLSSTRCSLLVGQR